MRNYLVEREGSFNLGDGCQPRPPYMCLPPRTLFVGKANKSFTLVKECSECLPWRTEKPTPNTPASPSSHGFMAHSFIYSSHVYWVAPISSCLKLLVEILYFQGFSLVYFQFYFIFWAKTFEQLSIPKVLGTPPRGAVQTEALPFSAPILREQPAQIRGLMRGGMMPRLIAKDNGSRVENEAVR